MLSYFNYYAGWINDNDLRHRFFLEPICFFFSDPSKQDNRIIQQKTKQLVDIVEQRNALVELLDEERKR